jgi:hypothetical protein
VAGKISYVQTIVATYTSMRFPDRQWDTQTSTQGGQAPGGSRFSVDGAAGFEGGNVHFMQCPPSNAW